MRTIASLSALCVIAAGCGLVARSAVAVAWQEVPPELPGAQGERPPPEAGSQTRVDYDSEPPYTRYERRWNRRFPAPYRRGFREEYYPYGRPYYPRRYGQVYEPDYGYYDNYEFDDGYIGGFHDGRRFQQWQTKAEMGLKSYLQAMRGGVEAFRSGDYGPATRQFVLACKLNQGDAASRLHAVHAMVAVGQYDAAVPALRRALQLQPKLVYLPLDIRSEYGAVSDFDAHLQQLSEAARTAEADAGLWLLLGYYQLFSDRAGEAVVSLNRAAELGPGDSAVEDLLEAARLSSPVEPEPAKRVSPRAEQGENV